MFVDATDAEDATANESNPRAGNEDDTIDETSNAESTAVDSSSRVVRLDTLLGKELFGKKEAEGPGSLLAARLVLPRLLKKLQKHVAVFGDARRRDEHGGPEARAAADQGARRPPRRAQARHLCQRAGGLRGGPRRLRERRAEVVFGGDVLGEAARNAETGVEISIQGNVLREPVHALRVEWGIPGKYIETEDKSK